MRYKKGSKVEVFSQKDVPSGAWRGAEIICGNGHTYTVRYDEFGAKSDEEIVKGVSRKALRPCPPTIKVPENCCSGDVVEVFDNFCWKMATISKVLAKENYLIRLLGSTREFKVNKMYLRVRLSRQDGNWAVIGKGSWNREDGKHVEQSPIKCQKNFSSQSCSADVKTFVEDGCFTVKEKMEIKKGSSKTLKRRLPDDAYSGAARKFRLTVKEGRRDRVTAANLISLREKVDNIASTREVLDDIHKHAFLNIRTTGFAEMDAERLKPNDDLGDSLALRFQSTDAGSIACSVGSCSIASDVVYEMPHYCSPGRIEDTDDNFCDAESLCQLGNEEGNTLFSSKEQLAEEIHNLELHAYRCTMEALHASGPLSWEQETLVTNLRLSLHISNDEHLMELRNLVSADSRIPIR